jgi:hypothetical protein
MADVQAAIADWSTTASSNSPSDATTIGAGLADNFQQIQATVRTAFASKGADIASATTTDLGAVPGKQHDITGTTTITGFGTVAAGIEKLVKFEGALTLTHNGTSLILPGGGNITTANGDVALMVSEGSGNWRCAFYSFATGQKIIGQLTVTGAGSFSGDLDVNGSKFNANATTGNTTATGYFRAMSATGVPAGGSADQGLEMFSSGIGLFAGSGAPTLSAPKGSIYLRTDGNTTNNRGYIATDSAGSWTALTTAG